MLPLCRNFLQGFFSSSSCRMAAESKKTNQNKTLHLYIKTAPSLLLDWFLRLRSCQLQAGLTSEVVEPSLLGSVMLNTVQVFFSVVHVVLEGPVTVVAEVSLPHGEGEILQLKKNKQKTPLQTRLKNTREEKLQLHFVCVVLNMV